MREDPSRNQSNRIVTYVDVDYRYNSEAANAAFTKVTHAGFKVNCF